MPLFYCHCVGTNREEDGQKCVTVDFVVVVVVFVFLIVLNKIFKIILLTNSVN